MTTDTVGLTWRLPAGSSGAEPLLGACDDRFTPDLAGLLRPGEHRHRRLDRGARLRRGDRHAGNRRGNAGLRSLHGQARPVARAGARRRAARPVRRRRAARAGGVAGLRPLVPRGRAAVRHGQSRPTSPTRSARRPRRAPGSACSPMLSGAPAATCSTAAARTRGPGAVRATTRRAASRGRTPCSPRCSGSARADVREVAVVSATDGRRAVRLPGRRQDRGRARQRPAAALSRRAPPHVLDNVTALPT